MTFASDLSQARDQQIPVMALRPDTDERVTSLLCPACGAMMYRARLLKGYAETDYDAERLTCALHGPLGPYRHIASDRVAEQPAEWRDYDALGRT